MKPNIFFLDVLCVSGTQLQNLLFFLEPVTSLVAERSTKCLPLVPRQRHVCFEKTLVTESYARNVLMGRITTLETQQVLFFCDAMHPGTCRHYLCL